MAGDVDTGMEKAEMKRLLAKSKTEPVNCAFGQGKEKTIALLLLDKVKGPRGVEKDLVKQFPDANNTRFGVALVDIEEDPKLVKFRINKTVSGAARKLVKTLKGTGYTKVEILLDDGTVVEKDAEEEEATETKETQAQESQPTPVDTAGSVPPPPPPMQEPKQPEFDKAALTQQWNELVKRIPDALAKAPLLKDQLTKMATDGQTNLKTNNLVYAAAAIEQLRRALDAVKAGATGAGRETFEKSSKLWHATREKLESEIERLRAEILATYEKSGLAGQLDAAYQARVGSVLDMLDESLSDKLDAAAKLIDPAPRARLVEEAKIIIQNHKSFVASDDTITELDANPFVPLQLRTTVGGMLAALEKAVR
jgi:uncharacterized protein YukE